MLPCVLIIKQGLELEVETRIDRQAGRKTRQADVLSVKNIHVF